MNLLHLRAFDAVARTGSFTAAATRLNVSQPAITSHVKALEDYYEVTLFRRLGRSVEPTDLGLELAEISRRLFTVEAEASELLQATKGLRRGTVRIASDGPFIVVPLLAAFRERFPGVRASLSIANTDQVQDALLAERADVTVQGRVEQDERIHAVLLATYRIVVFVAASHPWAVGGRQRVTLPDLDGQPVVVRERGSTTRRVFEAACRRARVRPDFVIETTSRETVKEAVAAGLGIGVISEAELRPDPRFHPIAVDGDLAYNEYLLCLERRRNLRLVRELVAVAEAIRGSAVLPAGLD